MVKTKNVFIRQNCFQINTFGVTASACRPSKPFQGRPALITNSYIDGDILQFFKYLWLFSLHCDSEMNPHNFNISLLSIQTLGQHGSKTFVHCLDGGHMTLTWANKGPLVSDMFVLRYHWQGAQDHGLTKNCPLSWLITKINTESKSEMKIWWGDLVIFKDCKSK